MYILHTHIKFKLCNLIIIHIYDKSNTSHDYIVNIFLNLISSFFAFEVFDLFLQRLDEVQIVMSDVIIVVFNVCEGFLMFLEAEKWIVKM